MSPPSEPQDPATTFDYWHQHRLVRIRGHEGDLPFGGRPLVLGPIVTMREPVWRSVVATAAAHADTFGRWNWESPLSPTDAAALAESLRAILERVERTHTVSVAPDIHPDTLPDPDFVREALRVLVNVLELAAAEQREVETWVE